MGKGKIEKFGNLEPLVKFLVDETERKIDDLEYRVGHQLTTELPPKINRMAKEALAMHMDRSIDAAIDTLRNETVLRQQKGVNYINKCQDENNKRLQRLIFAIKDELKRDIADVARQQQKQASFPFSVRSTIDEENTIAREFRMWLNFKANQHGMSKGRLLEKLITLHRKGELLK
ncbi:MAG: hypothetical protein WC479_07300 [Candidatus Izemoplasmatales bacterium]